MRIENTHKTGQAAAAQRKRAVSSGGGAFGELLAGTEDASAATASAPPPAAAAPMGLEGLLALQQEAPHSRAAVKEQIRHGEALLASLDRLRLALLAGTVSAAEAHRLTQTLRQTRPGFVKDPALAAILDDIETRAAVELAKLTFSAKTP